MEKEKIKKIGNIIAIIFVILSLLSNVYATDLKTELTVVEQASELKYLENDQGNISKTIVEVNKDVGEVTIELKVANEGKEKEEKEIYDNTEIYILVSENLSNNKDKLAQYTNYIETLSNNIFKKNSNTKIGIIGIKGTIFDGKLDESGNMIWGENDEGDVDGTAENAEIIAKLTNSVDEIKNGLNEMNLSNNRYRINLQAAVKLANTSYSTKTNKVLISLYDGVPDIAIGVCTQVSHGGIFSEYSTLEEAVIGKHKKIVKYTKNEILKLKTSNISFIQLRPDNTSYDETWYDATTGEKSLEFDGSPYVQDLYGTMENPVYGKMYTLNDATLDKIVTQYIYEDLMEIIQADINNVKIVDYFPEDIIKNFEFSYVGNPSIGTVTDSINTENNTITWDIGSLKGDEVATVRYKLKIKNMKNENILNKTITTNEKVVLTYQDTDDKDYTVTLSSSPKIKLTEVVEVPVTPVEPGGKDDTTAPGKIPQAGIKYGIAIAILVIITVAGIALFRYNKLKDI